MKKDRIQGRYSAKKLEICDSVKKHHVDKR